MADIVDRLRRTPLYEGHGEESSLGEEAAEEITTLRAEVERLKGNIESWRRIPGQVAETYEADIVRLTTALEAISRMQVSPDDAINRMTLTAAIKITKDAISHD
jgi:hypothetical protein